MDHNITINLPDFAAWGFWEWVLLYTVSAIIIWLPWHFSTLIQCKVGTSKNKERTFEKSEFIGDSVLILFFGNIFVFIGICGCIINPVAGVLGLVFLGEYTHPIDNMSVRVIFQEWLGHGWQTYARTQEEKEKAKGEERR